MIKLVVLSALFALAAAKPHLLSGYSAHVLPAAVSLQSRTDYISKPLVAATYAVPETVVVESAPVVASVAVPAAVSHQYRSEVINKPVVATYETSAIISTPVVSETVVKSAPVLTEAIVETAPIAYAAAPAAVSHQSRTDYVSEPIVAHIPVHKHLW